MQNESGKPEMTKHPHAEAFDLPGGPAFPVSIPGSGDNGAWGMSLRDWFAGQALAGLCNADTESVCETVGIAAQVAYAIADAMLERRSMKP